MKTKLKSLLAAALCAVGFAVMPSAAEAQTVTASKAYFYPAKADIAPKDDNRSHYQAYIIESADDGDAVLASAKEKGMSGIDSEKTAIVVNDKLGWQFAISEYGVTSLDIGAFSPASFDLTDNAYLVVFYHTDGVASEVCVLGAEPEKLEEDKLYFDADPFCSEGYNSGWQAMPPKQEVSAVSAEGFLDLTVGDRVVTADEEPIVVDPAWGEAKTAEVQIDGEGSARTYTALTIDTWDTTTLTPGRYGMTLTAGADEETAGFWKIDTTSWEVLDNSNITADKTFEEGKTYLVLGTNTVNGKTLTVEDRAKFEYGKGASGFLGGTVAELPKRYEQKTVGDLVQIVEKIKGCADNPWDIGVGVTAYTNGNELVIVGEGTIADLKEIPAGVKGGIETVTVAEATVNDAAAGSFYEWDGITVTLPDNWQGELPDEKGTWCGAKNVELTRWPMAVKNVKPQQRYPWNGLVDVTYDVSGTGSVKVVVSVTTNGVKAVANPTVTGDVTADLGDGKELKDVLKLTWDAKADFGDEGLHEKIKVKLSVAPGESD